MTLAVNCYYYTEDLCMAKAQRLLNDGLLCAGPLLRSPVKNYGGMRLAAYRLREQKIMAQEIEIFRKSKVW
jgi:hypothetical protein